MSSLFSELELYNESDVEQKFIYKLLTNPEPNGFGLEDSDFLTKPHIKRIKLEKGPNSKIYYPDYAIVINGVPVAILEAKAPNALGESFTEARQYATEINASYPSNINPCELIISTDGIDILVGNWDCDQPKLSLNNEDLVPTNEKFNQLIQLLSKNSLTAKISNTLSKIKKTSKYYKPKFMLGGRSVISEIVGENSFGANISIEYKHLFNPDSSNDRKEIVENAYIASKRRLSHVTPIERIVRTAIPGSSLAHISIEDTKKPTEIIKQLENHDRLVNEICLLVGSVGSGKSTFTDFLKFKALPNELKSATEWLNVNLNNAPLNREMIYDWVVNTAIEKIKLNHPKIDFDSIETIKDIYQDPLKKVKKGRAALYPEDSTAYIDIISNEIYRLQNDNTATLKELIKFIRREYNSTLIIVLDNCDKGNKDDQLLMFEVSTWLKKEFSCVIFLPLRDSTYDLYRSFPPLDTVIKDLVFRIDPPLLEDVLYERLKYLSRELKKTKKGSEYFYSGGLKVEIKHNEIETYLRTIVSSLFKDKFNKRLLVGLAGRNIRKGLEIVLDFCKSGHIPETEILKIRQSEGEHSIPSHLVSKIILKGNRKYYEDSDSNLKNLFYSSQDDDLPDPFVRISILSYLQELSRVNGPNGSKGFHKTFSVLHDLQLSGHSSNRLFDEINNLIKSGCIFSESQSNSVNTEDLISISASGLIHLELLKNINYLSTVSEDTLFRENQVAQAIKENIIGNGPFPINSKQTAISNAKNLIEYMVSYHKSHYLGQVRLLKGEAKSPIETILEDISSWINNIANNDNKFSDLEDLKTLYIEGSEHQAQIVSIQHYGAFLEFGMNGTGLVHKSKLTNQEFQELEVGEWKTVKVDRFNQQHKKFDLSLI